MQRIKLGSFGILGLTLIASTAVAQNTEAGKAGNDTAAATVKRPSHLKPGIIDTAGSFHTQARAWRIQRKGWVPEIKVLVHFPGVAEEDALVAQLKKGSKKVGKPHSCSPYNMMTEYSRNRLSQKFDTQMVYFQCKFPESHAQKKSGNFTIELSLKQTMEEKTTKLGSLALKVIDIKQGSQNDQLKLQTELRDGLVGPAFLHLGDRSQSVKNPGFKSIADNHHRAWEKDEYFESTHLNLLFWTKNDESAGRADYNIACLYGGKKITVKKRGYGGRDKSGGSYWTYTGKKGKKNVEWKEHNYPLNMLRLRPPSKRDAKPNNDQWHYLDKNPGTYACKIMNSGSVVGSFDFEIKGGEIVPHKCQSDINTTDNVYVIPFKDKGLSGEKRDKSLQKNVLFSTKKWSKGCPASK